MAKPLRVLNIEDSERDVALLRRHLSSSGYALTADRVETAEEMKAALKARQWDVILCDYSMPQFNALSALEVLKESGLDIPLIIISGTVGEAVAVEAMRTGAQDYLMKDNLVRLEPTIERELQEAENRHAKRQADNERKALFKIIQGSITTSNLDEFLNVVHEAISKIVYAENCIVMLHDAETDTFNYEFWADKHDPPLSSKPVGTGFGSYVLRNGKPLRLTLELKEEMIARGDATLSGTPSLSWVGIPLRTTSKTIGVMVVQNYEVEDAYSERDLEFLSSVGDQIALAIERKRAKEALEESEERNRELVENAIDIIYTHDLKGNYTSVNKAGEKITGYTTEEALKRNIADSVAPEDVAKARHMISQKLAGHATTAYEIDLIAKDGRRVSLEVNTRIIYENGVPTGVQGIARDVTERKIANAELKEKSALLEAQLNSSIDGILIVNEHGKQIVQNQQLVDLFKIPREIADNPDDSAQVKWVSGVLKFPQEFVDRVAYLYANPDEVSRDAIELKDGTILDRYSAPVTGKDGKHYGRIWNFRDITEQKKADEALRASNEKFHQLADNITDAFWIRSRDLKEIFYISPAFERIWGRPIETIQAESTEFLKYILPDDREYVEKAYEALTKTAPTIDIEYRIVRPDDEVRWLRTRGFQVRDAKGDLIRLAGVVSDITEQKQTSDALSESEDRYRTLFETSPDGVAMFNLQMEVLVANARAADIFGYASAGEMTGKNAFELIAPENLERAKANINGIFKSGYIPALESTGIRSDGTHFEVEFSATLIRNIDGQPHAILGVTRDITERKRIQRALEESEERYRELVENAIDVIYTLDLEGNYTSINRASEEITGYTVEETLKRNIVQSMAPEYRDRAKELLAAQVHGENLAAFELDTVAKDGHRISLEIRTRPITENGVAVGVQGIARDITKRKLTDAALRASEASFRSLFDTANDAILILNDGVFIDCNYRAELMFGCNKDWIIGRSPLEISPAIQPDGQISAEMVLSHIEQTLSGVPQFFEWQHIRKDGTPFDTDISLNKVDLRGETHIQSIIRDITKRKQIEKKIIENEAKFRDLFDNAPVAYHELDVNGCYTRINRTEELMLGYTNDELKGRHVSDFIVDKISRESVKAKLAGKLEYKPHERTFIRKDGTYISVLVGDRLIYDANGEISGIRTTLQDITERKLAEGLLVESQEQLTLAAESVNLGIWDWDIVENKLHWDNRMYELYGIRAEDFSGAFDAWQKGLHPEDLKTGDENIRAALANERPFSCEFRVVWPNGKVRNIEARAIVKRDTDGKPLRMIGVNWDITDRKELEEQYRQSQKMEAVGVLAGGIAHDFNNLLTAINGFSDLTLQRMEADSPFRNHIQEVRNAGERAAELTGQLLAFSRKQLLKPSVISLNSVIANIKNMLRRIISENIELRVVLDPKLGNVMADPGQIEQVIMNLAINARDAMPSGGNLTIETENIYLSEGYVNQHLMVSPGDYVRISVSDTGEGMDSAMQSHIFEPFFTTKEVGKGTGLGLATVYGIVKQSGGTIMVYSEVGHGTIFKIYFPRVDQAVERPLWPADNAASHAGTETILLVEDEDAVRGFVVEVLKSSGYTVLPAANGPEALTRIQNYTEEIHLLISDVIMPKMGGAELKKRVVDLRPEIKVLFISGYTDDSIADRGIDDPDVAFLEKPFTPDGLIKKVRDVLER